MTRPGAIHGGFFIAGMNANHMQDYAIDALTVCTFIVSVFGFALSFFDAHSKGITAMVAVAMFLLTWYYQHKRSKDEAGN